MKNLTYIQPQSEAKSVEDLTPFEQYEIDQYQDKNRGFDDDYLPLENYSDED